jgi:hypothetical protein
MFSRRVHAVRKHLLGWQLYCHPFPGAAVQLPHQLMETISED